MRLAPAELLQEPAEYDQRKEQRHRVGAALDLESGVGQDAAYLGTSVPPEMVQRDVMRPPKPLEGRHAQHQHTSRTQHTECLAQSCTVVFDVLKDIQPDFGIHAVACKRELGPVSDEERGKSSLGAVGKGEIAGIEADRLNTAPLEFGEDRTGAASDIEDSASLGQGAVKQRQR